MTIAQELSALQCNAAVPVYPPSVLAIASSTEALLNAAVAEFARIQEASPDVDRVEVKDNFVFTYHLKPNGNRLSCFGPGEGLLNEISKRFDEVAEFQPEYLDIFYHGEVAGDTRELVQRAEEWNRLKLKSRAGDESPKIIPAMLYVSRSINDIWHSQIGMIRGQSDVARYLRITAAFDLRARLASQCPSLEEFTNLVWSCLRFSLHGSLIRGRRHRPIVEPSYEARHLLFDIKRICRLREELAQVGLSLGHIRFDAMTRWYDDMVPLKEFAASAKKRLATSVCFFVTPTSAPACVFDMAADLRMKLGHVPLMVLLSSRDLGRLVSYAEEARLDRSEDYIMDRIRRALDASVVLHEYSVECESYSACRNRVVNRWPYAGLRGAQVRALAVDGYTELSGPQVSKNRHLLTLAQIQAASEGDPVGINSEDVDVLNVCSSCGSDSYQDEIEL